MFDVKTLPVDIRVPGHNISFQRVHQIAVVACAIKLFLFSITSTFLSILLTLQTHMDSLIIKTWQTVTTLHFVNISEMYTFWWSASLVSSKKTWSVWISIKTLLTFSSLTRLPRPSRVLGLSALTFGCPLPTGPRCGIAGDSFLCGFDPTIGFLTCAGPLRTDFYI